MALAALSDPSVIAWINALKSLDISWARRQIPAGDKLTREQLLIGLHKARYECVYLDAVYRHKSRDWLEKNGHDRMGGKPWPAKGVLEPMSDR